MRNVKRALAATNRLRTEGTMAKSHARAALLPGFQVRVPLMVTGVRPARRSIVH